MIRFSDASVSTVAMQGQLITAQATLRADGIGDLQQQHTVVVSENAVSGLNLLWPVPGYFVGQPSQDYAQFNDGSPNRHHAGMDIPAPMGTTPVWAAAGGTAKVYPLARPGTTHCMGNVVVIQHSQKATLYAHLNEITVSNGQTVMPGAKSAP